MTARLHRFARTALLSAAPLAVSAAPLDLSSWTPLTLNYPGGQGAGSWVLSAGNTTVKQVINADPSFYLNNLNQTKYSIDGTWRVDAGTGDDDYMGFVFGYQNSSNFYLFDWKQGTQGYVGRTAAEGMAIKKFTGATGSGLADLSLEEFWENQASFGDMTVLAKNQSTTAGWLAATDYTFHFDFDQNPGEIHVVVKNGATTLWDTTVVDTTFTGGQFGFFNNSQAGVTYAGFTQTGGVPVTPAIPEPETYALMLLGLGALGLVARRRRRA
ncbi:MAG: PEP-CTERM sorting domain-containing protein [Pseudomonadota bacterium]